MIDPEAEREGFISIRELVALIAAATGKTEQGAAAMLLASIGKHPKWSRLEFYKWDLLFGYVEIGPYDKKPKNDTIQRLRKWAESGVTTPGFEDFDDIPF